MSYAISEQQRRRSACASAQSDQRLCCSLPRQNDTSSLYIRNFKILAGLCSWAGQFVSCLVGDSWRHICSWRGSFYFRFMHPHNVYINWAASSECVSSSIPSWQILTAHAQPFSGARNLVFCLKVLLDSLLVWASSGGSGETARMRRLALTFAARIGDKYQIRLTRSNCKIQNIVNRLIRAFFHDKLFLLYMWIIFQTKCYWTFINTKEDM